jgi:4-amino-4-deoxy-L-arabinose transferase-like glycosyltransferase
LRKTQLIVSIILLGLILPLWSMFTFPNHGWQYILLKALAIFCLLNFFFIIYLIRWAYTLSKPAGKRNKPE